MTPATEDDVTRQWETEWEQKTRKLNSNADMKVFEVGPTGMLCIGDIALSVSDGYEVILPDVKPGIWRVSCSSALEKCVDLYFAWVAPGPLDVENLPAVEGTACPGKDAASPLEQLAVASIDSGKLGIIDEDMKNAVLEVIGEEQRAAELLTDPFSEGFVGEFALTGGYVANVLDGTYIVSGRRKDDILVELRIREYTAEEQEEGEREFDELD